MNIYKILCNKDLEKLISKGKPLELNLDSIDAAWPQRAKTIKGIFHKDEEFPNEEGRFIFTYRIGEYNLTLNSIISTFVRSSEYKVCELFEENRKFVKEWSNFIYEKKGELFLKQKVLGHYFSTDIMNAGEAYKKGCKKLDKVGIKTALAS